MREMERESTSNMGSKGEESVFKTIIDVYAKNLVMARGTFVL